MKYIVHQEVTAVVTDTHNETLVNMCNTFLVVSPEVPTALLLVTQVITNVCVCVSVSE
jgi:hypothetical protein